MSILVNRKILVVEDDKYEIANIRNLLTEISMNFRIAETVNQAFEAIRNEAFDLLLTDLHIETKAGFESPDGLRVIAYAKEQQPNLVIVANSSDPRSDIWNEALSAGAEHFIRKPISKSDELTIAFNLAKERKTLLSSKIPKMERGKSSYAYFQKEYPEGLVIDKADLQKAQGLARRSIPAVLTGETGTGKEEFARLVHRFRIRKEGEIPFVAVNCATISENLSESLLFGHKKGSFTGADQTTTGYIAEADGGILFLDEIHSLDIKIQQKLLRVLNDGTFNRLGETRTYTSRFQLICATTKDLDDEAEEGKFLLDLRGRISGIDIPLKPLRERKEHIPALTALFLMRQGIHLENHIFELLCNRLRNFYWRTNIRQLYKVLESWLTRCDFEDLPIHPDHLPYIKGMTAPTGSGKRDFLSSNGEKAPAHLHDLLDLAWVKDIKLDELIEMVEKGVMESAIKRHKTIGSCAEGLGISRSTFDTRRKRLGI